MLYLVATPIGNLGDITLRALETLREVDYVASEDTRHTGRLLKRYEIDKPQFSFYEENKERSGPQIINLLKQGHSVALVTNAGTPVISDPGFTLVRQALADSIPTTMIPGPSALIMAVALSGLAVHAFTFRGFPPRKQGARRRFLAIDEDSPHTLVFYESPYRLRRFLADALEIYGDRRVAVANELTKLYESVLRCSLSEAIARFEEEEPRGEYTIVIAGADDSAA